MSPSPSRYPILKQVHSVARSVLEKAGYKLEIRESHGIRIGLWRSKFTSPKKASRKGTLVLMPGFGDTPLSWLGVSIMLRPVVASRFEEFVMLDFPGFQGLLSEQECPPSMDALFSAVTEILDELKPRVLMGHSLGGWLGGHYTAFCGSRPRGRKGWYGPEEVILMSPAGVFGGESAKEELRNTFHSAHTKAAQDPDGRFPLQGSLFAQEPAWFRLISPEFSRFLSRKDTMRFLLSFRDEHALDSKLGFIRAQTWLIWGEDDKLVPAKATPLWLKGISGPARAVFIRKTGHGVQIERPAVLALILSQILSGHEPHAMGKIWWHTIEQPE